MAIFFIYYGVKSKALVDELYLEIEFTLTRSELYKKQNGWTDATIIVVLLKNYETQSNNA